MRIGPEVCQVQHDQFASAQPVGVADLECSRIPQCRHPAFRSGAVRFIDEIVHDIKQVLQLGLGEGTPFRRNRIVGRVLRSVPLKADLRL